MELGENNVPPPHLSDHDLLLQVWVRQERVLMRLRALEERMKETVSKDAFLPVRLIAYGLTTLLLVGTVGAIIRLVLR